MMIMGFAPSINKIPVRQPQVYVSLRLARKQRPVCCTKNSRLRQAIYSLRTCLTLTDLVMHVVALAKCEDGLRIGRSLVTNPIYAYDIVLIASTE